MVLSLRDEVLLENGTSRMPVAPASFEPVDSLISLTSTADSSVSELGQDLSGIRTLTETFQEHWQQIFSASGKPFTDYKLAYIFGFSLANHELYVQESWERLEPSIQAYWEQFSQNTWAELKAAIQFGYEVAFRLR